MMIAGTERRRQGCSLQDGKQWGINTGGAVRTSTLPIPFTNVFLAVASTSSEWCCPGCSATNTTVTTRAYQSNRPDVAQLNDVNWIIIGCQPQWGINSAGNDGSEGESGWYAFHVNFNSACFALFCGLRNTDTNKPTNYDQKYSHVTGQPPNSTYTNKIMAVIHGLVVSFGLLLADSQPVTSYNPTATL